MYEILGLKPGAEIHEIKEAYRKLVKRHHPDLSHTPRNHEKFAKITQAYKDLSLHMQKKKNITFPFEKTAGRNVTEGMTEQEKNVFEVGKKMLATKDPTTKAFLVRKLGNTGKKSAYVYLRKVLYDSDQFVVVSAIQAIGKLQIQQSAGELGAVFTRGNKEIKECILQVIEKMESPGNFRNILLAAMRDNDYSIKKHAFYVFNTLRGDSSIHRAHGRG